MTSLKRKTSLLVAAMIGCLTPCFISRGLAQDLPSARAVGLAHAYTALARGHQASHWNPANLGLSGNPKVSLNLLSFSAGLYNNSYSRKDVDKYNGAVLTSIEEVDEFINHVPSSGLNLNFSGGLHAVGVSVGRFAAFVTGTADADFILPKDLVSLMEGNTEDSYDISGLEAESIGLVTMGVSGGFPIRAAFAKELALGATAKYHKGLAYARVLEAHSAILFEPAIYAEGKTRAQVAEGGGGFSMDFGAALVLKNDWQFGLTFMNLLSSMTWDKKAREFVASVSSSDTVTVRDIMRADDVEDIFPTTDEERELSSISAGLPGKMVLGASRSWTHFIVASDLTLGFKNGPATSTKPRWTTGVEWRPGAIFGLRTGLGIGGRKGFTSAIGFGFIFRAMRIDYGYVNYRGMLPFSYKGFGHAFSMQFYF